MYDQSLIDAVLKHADIVQVISAYIPVTKKGRNYVALCPFHDDKNPSMQISTDKQIFKCFVCGSGGNAIGFVQKHEKCSFSEAVRKVANLVGYNDTRLVEEAPKVHVDPSLTKLYDCINDLQTFYRYGLTIPESAKAREYLEGRDINAAMQEKYGVGYAPKDGQMTVAYLQKKGHSLKSIEDIGIALLRGEKTADSNAGRIVFPLCDPRGQVVGFSTRRIIDDGSPKYINSPDGVIFQKGNILYNYHNAAQTAHRDGYCYVLEGFMDVMALDKAGIPNAVALMGTALTPQQVNLLKRLRCEIRLCLDGDGPGQHAMMGAISSLGKSGVRCRVVDYQGDLRDPDEIIRDEGIDALKKRLENLIEPIDFQLAYYTRNEKLESPEERRKALATFLPYLRNKPAGIEFEDMLIKLSEATGYQPEAIREIARQSPKQETEEQGISLTKPTSGPMAVRRYEREIARLSLAERTLAYYMLQKHDAIAYYEKNIGSFTSSNILSSLAEFLVEFTQGKDEDPDIGGFITYVEESGVEGAEEISSMASEIALAPNILPLSRKSLDDCAKIIADESAALSDKMTAKQAVEQGSLELGAQANKDLAAKVREQWANRPRKGK